MPNTIIINNFEGNLVRETFGDINSGASPYLYGTSGINPFYDGNNSTIVNIQAPTSIGSSVILDPIMKMVACSPNFDANASPYVFGAGLNGNFYKVQCSISSVTSPTPDQDSIAIFTQNLVNTLTLKYGGGFIISKIDNTQRLYVGGDVGVYKSGDLDQSSVVSTAWTALSGSLDASRPRPLVEFLGKLYAGNGSKLAESSDGTTFSVLDKFIIGPGLPPNYTIKDLAISNDGRYLVILASTGFNNLTTYDLSQGVSPTRAIIDSAIILWNGSDTGFSSIQLFKGINLTKIVVSNTETLVIGNDDTGVTLFDVSGNPVATISDVSNVLATSSPYSVGVIGRKIFFLAQQGGSLKLFVINRDTNKIYVLWSTTITKETVKGDAVVASYHVSTVTPVDISRAKIYFSYSGLPIATQGNNILNSLHLQFYSGDSFQSTIYSTQVTKFPKKVQLKELRVFCSPTSSGQSLTLELISPITTISSPSLTYTYASGTDETQLKGSLDVLKFYPQISPIQALGLRLTLGGGMIIYKVEVDYEDVVNPKTK